MNEDLCESKMSPEEETSTFNTPTPKIPTGIAYHQHQQNLFNVGIHVESQNQDIFNVGQQIPLEVGSCIMKYNREHIRVPVKELRLWPDSCGG